MLRQRQSSLTGRMHADRECAVRVACMQIGAWLTAGPAAMSSEVTGVNERSPVRGPTTLTSTVASVAVARADEREASTPSAAARRGAAEDVRDRLERVTPSACGLTRFLLHVCGPAEFVPRQRGQSASFEGAASTLIGVGASAAATSIGDVLAFCSGEDCTTSAT